MENVIVIRFEIEVRERETLFEAQYGLSKWKFSLAAVSSSS